MEYTINNDPPSGGYLVGNSHENGGIKGFNKATGQYLEFEGGEVVITKPAVNNPELFEFEGKMMTNREILSAINVSGEGVAFAEKGMELPSEIYFSGNSYKFSGETLKDSEIFNKIRSSINEVTKEAVEIADQILEKGGIISSEISPKTKKDIDFILDLQKSKKEKTPTGWDIGLFKSSFTNKAKKLSAKELSAALDYMTEEEKRLDIPKVFTGKHKIWERYLKSDKAPENAQEEITELYIGSKNPLSTQLQLLTGDSYSTQSFENLDGSEVNTIGPFRHKKSGRLFEVAIPVEYIGVDDWSNDLYKNHNGAILVEVDGVMHTMTDEGEPLYPIKAKIIKTDDASKYVSEAKQEPEKPEISTDPQDYKNPYEINRAVERIIDNSDEYTPEQKKFFSFYSGYGGLEKFGATGKGILYEYFTPLEIVKKMWGLAYKYGFGDTQKPKVFEPSVGSGNFFMYAPENAILAGNEINEYSRKICMALYPNSEITLQSFEQNFIKRNLSIRGNVSEVEKYNLVIGNPPYGKFVSKYAGMGEADYSMASNFTEYFITRGLDMLYPGGLLIFVVGAEQYNGGTFFLDSAPSSVKRAIFEKANLMDAYRLPTKIFERTGVASEIIVFQKR